MPITSTLYPLRFKPIYQYRLWGGRKLEKLLSTPLPEGPIGEAWILSDRDDFPSQVMDGPLAGMTLKELIADYADEIFGALVDRYARYPLLLKYLDAREMLSVQVHPSDLQPELLPPGELGKTEAWVVLESDPTSQIFAGLNPGTTANDLRHLTAASAENHLASFHPKPGDGLFIPAGTVHALGGGVLVFEVQQNSDVTFRLFDWDRVDAKTGKSRELHIEDSLRCIDVAQGPVGPVTAVVESESPVLRERLFDNAHFTTWRIAGDAPFSIGRDGAPRVAVVLAGQGAFTVNGTEYPFATGDVILLPAVLGALSCRPEGPVTLLEIGLPSPTAPSVN